MVDGGAFDFDETVATEELHLECQDEDSLHANRSRSVDELFKNQAADSASECLRVDGKRANLGEVLPHAVQCATANNIPIKLSDHKLLYVFVERDGCLAQQPSIWRERVNQLSNLDHVSGAGRAQQHLVDILTLGGLLLTHLAGSFRRPAAVRSVSTRARAQ